MPNNTTVKKGESWASIAKRLYGDERMMGELMRANGGVLMLKPGQKINAPNKVSNPFVSFAQAAYGAGTIEAKKPGSMEATAQYIGKLQGGQEWLNKFGPGAGATTTPTTQPTTFGSVAGNPQQMAQAQFAQNALNQRNPSLAPASRAAQENAVSRVGSPTMAPTSFAQANAAGSPYNKPASFTSQPKGTTRYLPGQQQAGALMAGPNAAPGGKPAWMTTPMNQTAAGKAVLAIPGAIGGALSQFGQNIASGFQTGLGKTAEAGKYDANASPFQKFIAGTQGQPNVVTEPVTYLGAGSQSASAAATPTEAKQPTGANNIRAKIPAAKIAQAYEAHQAAMFIFESDPAVTAEQYKYGLSNQAAIDAYRLSGYPDPALAEQQVATDLARAGWTRSGSEWLPPQPGQTGLPDNLDSSSTTGGRLNWQNLDLSTLSQMGFYDEAPYGAPTYSSTGRDTEGGSQPAPSYNVLSGQSWRINP